MRVGRGYVCIARLPSVVGAWSGLHECLVNWSSGKPFFMNQTYDVCGQARPGTTRGGGHLRRGEEEGNLLGDWFVSGCVGVFVGVTSNPLINVHRPISMYIGYKLAHNIPGKNSSFPSYSQ